MTYTKFPILGVTLARTDRLLDLAEASCKRAKDSVSSTLSAIQKRLKESK